MKKIWIRIYSTYGLLIFAGVLICLYPFFLLMMIRKSWLKYALFLNQIWARAFLTLSFIPPIQEWRTKLKPGQNYLLVGNHSSFLDIVLMGYVPKPCVFVGKVSLAKVPIFGYMFKKLHITVDRRNPRSRYQVLKRGAEVLEKGYSLVMFPEGGIRSDNPPELATFRNGAFKLAIEKGVPIVPVTYPHNWKIQPGNHKMLMYPQRPRMIIHEAIETKDMDVKDANALRDRVFHTIQEELSKYYPNLALKHAESFHEKNAASRI
ncbi:lysophospholipid acyltransferase family protein [Catalinimonas sp. 4WD22]|uniref:lysophospholipid acyltransferase family protein n=1 Tax=Catalinimonas locisalis TaxID=3133978 RepID=UPI003101A247